MIAIGTGNERWGIAAIVALLMVAATVLVFQPPSIVLSEPARPVTGIEVQKVTAAQSALSEETMMRDLAPLFLPTERNATLRRLPTREPGQNFLEVEAPRFVITDSGWRFDRGMSAPTQLNHKPVSQASALDYLEEVVMDAPATGMGRAPQAVPALSPRAGVLEVFRTQDGQRVIDEKLPPELRPPTEKEWRPMELLASVGPAGLIAPLSISVRSGVDEVDLYFRNFLTTKYQIGVRLPPGFYRISIAP